MRKTKYGKSLLALICFFSIQAPVYAEEIPDENINETTDIEQENEEITESVSETDETEEIIQEETETVSEDPEESAENTENEVQTEEFQVEQIISEDIVEEEPVNGTVFRAMMMTAPKPAVNQKTNIDENVGVTETTEKLTVHQVTVIDGSADVSEATKGTIITLTPAEKSGYKFKGWIDEDGDLVSGNEKYSFAMPEWDVTFTASFEKTSNWGTDGRYYLNDNSYAKDQWLEIDGNFYRFDSNGHALVSTWYKENGKWFYLDEEGVRVSGWKKVNGTWYYMNNDGIMQTGWKKISGNWYYLQSSGAMKKGWLQLGQKWYFLNGSGVMVTGWKEIGGKKYYFGSSGEMKTGWLKLDKTWYYLDPVNGDLKTGWQEINKKKYYLDESTGAMANSWLVINNKKVHFDTSGALSVGWKRIDSKWYYFDDNGLFTTGWKKIKKVWYYMNNEGVMQTGWQKINGTWYYMDNSGAMQTGWIDVDGKRYYLKDSGAMVKGWQKVNKTWYYFDGSGAMKKGWIRSGSKWYYLDNTGAMVTGWKKSGNKWYYLSSSGAMITGLQKINSKWYYFDPENGEMLVGKVKIDTISYEFGSNGELASISHNDIAYYSQTDPRWADVQYGDYKPIKNTGCVPTTATTVVNYLKGTDYTPADLAKEFYNWGEYNYVDHGTNSTVWRKYATNYNLTYQNQMTYNQIVNALKDGKVCTAAMGNGYFATMSYTHEISFFGLDSVGRTYVYDPLVQSNNGWYSVRDICNQLSTTYGDTLDGGPVYSFSNPSGAPKGSSTPDNPSVTSIGKAETLVSVNVRSDTVVSSETKLETVSKGKVYDVYEVKGTGEYTWYRIGINRWIADDGEGSWIKFTKN